MLTQHYLADSTPKILGMFENTFDIKAIHANFYEVRGNLYHTGNDNGGAGKISSLQSLAYAHSF